MARRPGAETPRPWLHRVVGTVVLLGLTAAPAGAATTTSSTLPPATSGPPPSTADTSTAGAPPLAPAGADEAGRLRAAAELRQIQLQRKAAAAVAARAARAVKPAAQRLAQAQAHLDDLNAQDKALADQLAAARDRLRGLAVASYVTSGSTRSVDYLLDSDNANDLTRRRALVASATDVQQQALTTYSQAHDAVSGQLDGAVREVEDAKTEQAKAVAEATAQADVVAELAGEVQNRQLLLDLVTAAAPVPPSDVPRLFLDAYRRAALTMRARVPGCRVGWTALAGIGRVESDHGRFHGARLALNGDIYPRIVGLPLDGTRGTAVIPDSDKGTLDGDTAYDHAVGPMQFIPSTWKRVGQDGNGDGKVDPYNAYDAALTAGTYLCRANPNGNLDTDDGLRPALYSYNHSNAYVETVLSITHGYDAIAAQLPAPPPPTVGSGRGAGSRRP